jgi:hypothetical protein
MAKKIKIGTIIKIVRIGSRDAYYDKRDKIIGHHYKVLSNPVRFPRNNPYFGCDVEILDHQSLYVGTFAYVMAKVIN